MPIRNAKLEDHDSIRSLLDQLDYSGTQPFLLQKMIRILNDPSSALAVFEHEGRVAGFISINFITQLALEGDFARISYLVVDASFRSEGIGAQFATYAEQLARNRNCDRIEVHCHERRKDALRFYEQQGFAAAPAYLTRSLV